MLSIIWRSFIRHHRFTQELKLVYFLSRIIKYLAKKSSIAMCLQTASLCHVKFDVKLLKKIVGKLSSDWAQSIHTISLLAIKQRTPHCCSPHE